MFPVTEKSFKVVLGKIKSSEHSTNDLTTFNLISFVQIQIDDDDERIAQLEILGSECLVLLVALKMWVSECID